MPMTSRRSSLTIRWVVATLALAGLLVSGCRKRGEVRAEPPSDTAADADGELDQICAHDYEVLIAATGVSSPGVRDEFMTSCLSGAEAKRESMAEAAWDERVSCVLAAETSADLGRCDGREPLPPPEPLADTGLETETVCRHLFELLELQFGGQLIPPEEMPEQLESCAAMLAEERAEDPAKFEREARCLMSATSVDEADACGL